MSHPTSTERPMTSSGRRGGRMTVETWIFLALTAFFFISAIIYGLWAKEVVGIVALGLTGGLCVIIGSFLWFTGRRLEDDRPEDREDAEIADGAGDVGFFAPGSYWPITIAAAAAFTGIALAFMLPWMIIIGIGLLLLAVCGLVFEYHKGGASH